MPDRPESTPPPWIEADSFRETTLQLLDELADREAVRQVGRLLYDLAAVASREDGDESSTRTELRAVAADLRYTGTCSTRSPARPTLLPRRARRAAGPVRRQGGPPGHWPGRGDRGAAVVSGAKRSDEEIEEARILGKALAALRVSQGMTQGQVAERAGLAKQRICKAERGYIYPRQGILKRILGGMGATFAALHRAQGLVQDPMGEEDDAPDCNSEEAHRAAVRLAQEAGKAVAHCCLAFMELQAGGWEDGRHGE